MIFLMLLRLKFQYFKCKFIFSYYCLLHISKPGESQGCSTNIVVIKGHRLSPNLRLGGKNNIHPLTPVSLRERAKGKDLHSP